MKTLYIILLLSTFIMGIYDGGDMTVFVMLLLFGTFEVISSAWEKRKKRCKN